MSEPKEKAKEATGRIGQEFEEAEEYVEEEVKEQIGGPARLQVIAVLAAVLGLDGADKAAVSAVASSLKSAFNIGNTEIGVLIAVVSFMGAVATLPIGILVDRMRRQYVLLFSISLWSAAMVVSGTSNSFLYLLITRLFLGAVTAAALPAVASLTGDFFPASERARIYGMILSGELIGTGIGFVIAGEASSWINWRWAFYLLSIPSAALAWVVWRYLPEPARGGQSWLKPGQREVLSEEDVQRGKRRPSDGESSGRSEESELAQEEVKQADIPPREGLVLKADPVNNDLWWAVKYVLRIRTNLLLIIASALAYYFFAGVRAFAMIYLTSHYDISRSTASGLAVVLGVGALAGIIAGGRLADRMLKNGWVSSRIIVPGVALFISVLLFAPGIWTTSIFAAMALFVCAAASLSAANPPLDAARLDIMHPRLWGRAESVRTTLRMSLEGAAPIVFGYISQHWFGGRKSGLMYTFLLMLLPVIIASLLAIPARRTYPRDVSTAAASAEATYGKGE